MAGEVGGGEDDFFLAFAHKFGRSRQRDGGAKLVEPGGLGIAGFGLHSGNGGDDFFDDKFDNGDKGVDNFRQDFHKRRKPQDNPFLVAEGEHLGNKLNKDDGDKRQRDNDKCNSDDLCQRHRDMPVLGKIGSKGILRTNATSGGGNSSKQGNAELDDGQTGLHTVLHKGGISLRPFCAH